MWDLSSFGATTSILGAEGWKPLTTCLNICIFNRPKMNLHSTQFIQDFRANKTCWSGCRVQFESKIKPLGLCLSSGNHFLRLSQKAIEGFHCKINGQALVLQNWASTLAQLRLV